MSRSNRLFLTLMLACAALFCALGVWQVKRLHWKNALMAEIEQAYSIDPSQKIISVHDIIGLQKNQFLRGNFTGLFDFDRAFELSGQIDDGKQTSHVMVPFILSQDVTILVDMGPGFKKPDLRNYKVTITGLLKPAPVPNKFTPDNVPSKNIWYRINKYELGMDKLYPVVVMPEDTPWKTYPSLKPELRNAHLQYALFWFTMALVTLGMTGYYLKRNKG